MAVVKSGKTWVRSLGWEEPLKNGYLHQYSGLENSVQSMGSQRIGHDYATFTFLVLGRMGSRG